MTATEIVAHTDHGAVAALDFGGDGVPMVLLHGGSRTLADWGAVIPRLTPHLRVVAVDFHSHGRSEDVSDFNWRNGAADVTAVVSLLGLDRPIVAGHSLGGMIASVYAATYGAVRGVMNVDGYGAGLPSQLDGMSLEEATATLAKYQQQSLTELGATPDVLTLAEKAAEVAEVQELVGDTDLDWTYVQGLLERGYRSLPDGTVRRSPSSEVNVAMYRSLMELDMPTFYDLLPCPAVMLRSVDEVPEDQEAARFVSAFHRGVTQELAMLVAARPDVVVVEEVDCGHMIPLERPEWLADRLLAFAAQLGADLSRTNA